MDYQPLCQEKLGQVIKTLLKIRGEISRVLEGDSDANDSSSNGNTNGEGMTDDDHTSIYDRKQLQRQRTTSTVNTPAKTNVSTPSAATPHHHHHHHHHHHQCGISSGSDISPLPFLATFSTRVILSFSRKRAPAKTPSGWGRQRQQQQHRVHRLIRAAKERFRTTDRTTSLRSTIGPGRFDTKYSGRRFIS